MPFNTNKYFYNEIATIQLDRPLPISVKQEPAKYEYCFHPWYCTGTANIKMQTSFTPHCTVLNTATGHFLNFLCIKSKQEKQFGAQIFPQLCLHFYIISGACLRRLSNKIHHSKTGKQKCCHRLYSYGVVVCLFNTPKSLISHSQQTIS